MTTLRDLLRDFGNEAVKQAQQKEEFFDLEALLDETVEEIVERIIG